MEELASDDRMNDADKILWVIESNPQLRSTITAVLVLDRSPDRAIVSARVERATRKIERLRQRVVWNPYSIAPPRWELDPTFNLSYHLRWANLGGTGTQADLLTLAEPLAMQAFDKARPLWEITVVEGLTDGRAALVTKVHHTIADGVGGIQLMLELFDFDREQTEQPAMPPPPVGRVLSQSERFRHALAHEMERRRAFTKQTADGLIDIARDPVEGVRRGIDTALSAIRLAQPTTRPMSPLLEAKSLSVRFRTIERPLEAFRAAAHGCDSTINDVFVTGLCRGLFHWHTDRGLPISTLRMGMPISLRGRGAQSRGANQFLPTRFEVPLSIDPPREHVHAVRDRIRGQRDEPALQLIEPLAGVVSRLPRVVLTNLFSTLLRGQDFLSSNVPGAPVPLYFAGAELSAMFAFGPLSGTALNVTLLSHCDRVFIGVTHDPQTIADSDQLGGCLARGLDEVLALGTPTPSTAARAPKPTVSAAAKARTKKTTKPKPPTRR